MSVYLDPSQAIQASVPSHALPCFAAEQLVVSPGLRNSYRQVFGTAVGKPTHPGCDEENDQKTKKTTLSVKTGRCVQRAAHGSFC